jgi:hypothetical protein
MRLLRAYIVVLLIYCGGNLAAQRVLYSPYINYFQTDHFEPIGKTGNHYWVQRYRGKNKIKIPQTPGTIDRQPYFDIYDSRLNMIRTINAPLVTDSSLKEYFICSSNCFDQLTLFASAKKTFLSVNRYTPDGTLVSENKIIDSLPFEEPGNSFLLLRSENKKRLLLIGFESIPSSAPRVHALLFDENWQLLLTNTYHHRYLSQPQIQTDFFNYPVENFSNSAVKLADNGEWLMVAISGRNQNYSLFHFNSRDTAFAYNEIRLPRSSSVEDIALSVNNENEEATAGILSRIRYSALKNVEIVRYSLPQREISYDSSFRFNTLVADDIKNNSLYSENFVAAPGGGFILLKEYGKGHPDMFSAMDSSYDIKKDREIMFANNIATNNYLSYINKDEFTKYNTLAGPRSNYNRGDLSLFYIPAGREDSSWSGLINKAQITDLNSSYLSYFVMPANGKLFFLYNTSTWNESQFGSTTVLDYQGHELIDDGILFSKINYTILFQKARQISANEIMIPYQRYKLDGFAVVRF